MYHKWRFEDFFAALYVEQTGIALLKRFDYKQVYENDWFGVNNDTIDVVIELIGKLARPIVGWESDNRGLKCDASQRNTPYGTFLRTARISKKEMLHRAYAAGAEGDY